jgi:hypothetical protein
LFGGFPRNEEFMQPFFVLVRGERIVPVSCPQDERFRLGDEENFLLAGLTPSNEFDLALPVKLELAKFPRLMAR